MKMMGQSVTYFAIFSLVLLHISTLAQNSGSDEMRVKKMVQDFNSTVFLERNLKKAVGNYVFAEESDSIDLEGGFNAMFPNVTRKVSSVNKSRYFAMELYWEGGIPILQWALGTKPLSNTSNLVDAEILAWNDNELQKAWDIEYAKAGIRDENDLSERTLQSYEIFVKRIQRVIARKSNDSFLRKNLETVNDGMTFGQSEFKGRKYFVVRNILFSYEIAIKSGNPKIMRINRTQQSRS